MSLVKLKYCFFKWAWGEGKTAWGNSKYIFRQNISEAHLCSAILLL
jgi:hypothetical protein